MNFDDMDNTELMASARTTHGALYKRINTIQRDLNIVRESLRKAQNYIHELEIENKDLKELNARKWEEKKSPTPSTPITNAEVKVILQKTIDFLNKL